MNKSSDFTLAEFRAGVKSGLFWGVLEGGACFFFVLGVFWCTPDR